MNLNGLLNNKLILLLKQIMHIRVKSTALQSNKCFDIIIPKFDVYFSNRMQFWNY